VKAFQAGAPIITDVRMVAAGIQTALRDAMHIPLHCFLDDADIAAAASARGTTRCAVAMERAINKFPEAVFVIGNAPTALATLTTAIRNGSARPRLMIAAPVGFVGVLESKEEAMAVDNPVIAVRGRRGGSAIAAAAVNALLVLAQEGMQP
jgi:precorrin-8X/cobalt-precorrin-8 methylmutase